MIIVDRIVNGFAVCEINGVMTDIPLSRISGRVREGDMLSGGGGDSLYTVDIPGTERRRAAISERFERLKARKNT